MDICLISIFFASLLGGMETGVCISKLKHMDIPLYKMWVHKPFYIYSCIWLILMMGLYMALRPPLEDTGNGAAEAMLYPRLISLVLTYVLLSAVDLRLRIIPDEVLLLYLISQLLMASSYISFSALLLELIVGLIFLFILFFAAWVFKGRIGLGDTKLMGVTAMTAGIGYTLSMVFMAFMLSFVYSVIVLLIKKKNRKDEIPFVPFLTIGMLLQLMILGFGGRT